MTDILLGLIALGTLITALLQVIVIVSLVRTAKRTFDRIERLRAMVEPLPQHLANIRDDIDKARAVADRQLGHVARLYDAVEPPLRHGLTAFSVAKTVMATVRRFRR